MTMTSRYSELKPAAPLERIVLNKIYEADGQQEKVNLGNAGYRTEHGRPMVMQVVRQAELALTENNDLYRAYYPPIGSPAFRNLALQFLLGKDNPAILENRCFGVQILSAICGLRLAGEFLIRTLENKTAYCSKQTSGSQKKTLKVAGFEDVREYRYWSTETMSLNFKAFLEDLRAAPENSVVYIQMCGHNPTGCDPTIDQWEEIVEVFIESKLFPIFDSSWQGIVSGDADQDAYPVRLFVSRGIELFCTQSFGGNFGVYNERVGNLAVVVNDPNCIKNMKDHFIYLVRGMFENCSHHGAEIVHYIVSNPVLFEEWKNNVKSISSRLIEMRKALRDSLEEIGTPGDWSHITKQRGMFSFTGLNRKQANHMVQNHHVYMLRSGRINISGINKMNVNYIARAFKETLLNIK